METNIKMGPSEQYLYDLSRRVLDDHDMQDTPVIFRKRRKSTGWDRDVVYGTGSIEACMNGGDVEYTTVARALGISTVAHGKFALYLVAIHECAHAIQFGRGKARTGNGEGDHGPTFIATMHELLEKYPHKELPKLNRLTYTRRSREWCMARYGVGDPVIFNGPDGNEVHGVIRAFNPKSMTIEGMDECGDWRFHYAAHDKFRFRKAVEWDFGNLFD